MNARERDVLDGLAARAHEDAEPVAKQAARKLSVSGRTARRWANSGPPAVKEFFRYLRAVSDTWRIAAEAQAEAKRATVEGLTRAELIVRYRALLVTECEREGDDRRLDVTRDTPWLDRATASVRDAAIDAEKSAIERRFAELNVRDTEVWA